MLQTLLTHIRGAYCRILGSKLLGIYVHGSIAFDCFRWEQSDIDFLVVVRQPLLQAEKEALIAELLKLNDQAPPKGFEMSVILASVCRPFIYPTPYELHFSNSYLQDFREDLSTQCRKLQGTDRDLAAHITVTGAVGFPLCGPPVSEVFAPVSREAYIDSLLYDIENAETDIVNNPVYFVLNLCRVLAYLEDGKILSKKQGGEWGAARFPRHAALIRAALTHYVHGSNFSAPQAVLAEFAAHMLGEIRLYLPHTQEVHRE